MIMIIRSMTSFLRNAFIADRSIEKSKDIDIGYFVVAQFIFYKY